ncbi:uncharacterized protein [Drosophila takahashii]|uniref:uncharacterized protein n=1 Tax=Drosophila takahashii TaxID=29030 RepID=UPI001CF7EEA7|nr:uncharacterized protein LOC108056970 [Drosophila takahashii]
MKSAVVIILTLFVASGWAQPLELPADLEAQVQSLVEEMTEIAKATGEALEQQYVKVVQEPQKELEDALDQMELSRQESPECVAAQDQEIASIVDVAEGDLQSCRNAAAQTSAEIVSDVSDALQQLVFGGYDLVAHYQKCKNTTNSVLQVTCQIRLAKKFALYMSNGRKSIETIRQSISVRIPAVIDDYRQCIQSASSQAMLSLQEVNSHIDVCISQPH